MQASHATALESVEYRVAFLEPSAEVREPIAGRIRDLLAIIHQSGVTRAAVKPYLEQLNELHMQDELQMRAPPPPSPRQVHSQRQQRLCSFCGEFDALIEEHYEVVCTLCGMIAGSSRIQAEEAVQPKSQHHCAISKHAEFSCPKLDLVEAHIRNLCSTHRLAVVHMQRALYLATMCMLREPKALSGLPLLAASCLCYALLESWAAALKGVNVYCKKQQKWIVWWVLPHAIKRKYG